MPMCNKERLFLNSDTRIHPPV